MSNGKYLQRVGAQGVSLRPAWQPVTGQPSARAVARSAVVGRRGGAATYLYLRMWAICLRIVMMKRMMK